jgi:hypothetical protein
MARIVNATDAREHESGVSPERGYLGRNVHMQKAALRGETWVRIGLPEGIRSIQGDREDYLRLILPLWCDITADAHTAVSSTVTILLNRSLAAGR